MASTEDRASAEGRLYRDRNLLIIFGVTSMAVSAVASITPVFPEIVDELAISDQQVGWLIAAFTAPGVALAPFLGVMADRFGRKRILVPSLFLFSIAGAACALPHDFSLILLLRVLQGIGGAGLASLNVTIIGDLYSGQRRTAAMGLNASVLTISIASFPLIGGALGLLGWRYPFLLPLAAIPIGVIVLTSLHSPEARSQESLGDYLRGTWRCLKNIRVVALFAAGVLVFIILYGAYLTYLALLLGSSFRVSPFTIGIIMSAMALTTALVSSQMGRITRWRSEGTLIKVGFAIYAVALGLIPLMPSLWLFLVPVLIFGIGHGITIPSIQTLVAGLAPLEYRAALMSTNAIMLRLGQTVGPPLVGLVYVYWGFSGAFFAAAILAAAVPVIAIIMGRAMGSRIRDETGAAS